MKEFLNLDEDRVRILLEIKQAFLANEISAETAKKEIQDKLKQVTPEEFAYVEQQIKDLDDINDDLIHEKMDDLLALIQGILIEEKVELPEGHPIQTYQLENIAVLQLLEQIKALKQQKFKKNEWLSLYEQLEFFKTHLARKQNQLFSLFEKKGFDRPSKIMWLFDNEVRDIITASEKLLAADQEKEFLEKQEEVIHLVEDIIDKEERILFPTSLKLISEAEFRDMRAGDDEIGYCLISKPVGFYPEKSAAEAKAGEKKDDVNLLQDLSVLLAKHGINATPEKEIFDVKQGKLTLEQINLIYQHLPVDLSFVDENELVKFYSDTKHRIFPRSAGVIGREVKNCHPKDSVAAVENIIKAFRSGEKDEAEFWLEVKGTFIYIIYTAVRDAEGNFKGVLEMMQDATHIRSLKGEQRILTWATPKNETNMEADLKMEEKVENKITKDSVIGNIIKKYPYIKDFLIGLSPKYQRLNNPVMYKMMSKVATIEMIAERGEFKVEDLIEKIEQKIQEVEVEKEG